MSNPRRVYQTRVAHVRREPWRRGFAHRSWMWVVDVDAEPIRRGIKGLVAGRMRAEDHLDGRDGSLREALARFAEREGVVLGSGRILLAAQPRAWGYCFNPISVWWSLNSSGELALTVVEVHNTYGDRHAYVIRPDAGGRAQVDKAMYVSPFHGVEGTYEVFAPLPDEHLDLRVSLHVGDHRFSATLIGRQIAAPPWWIGIASMRDAFRIRVHGITLWARRLPVHPRPRHHQEALK